jgi:hypothetical protein
LPDESSIGFWDLIVGEWYLGGERQCGMTPISERWMDVFGAPTIPYDLEHRREKMAHAFERLAEHIGPWEAVRARLSRGESVDQDLDQ